jgi:hypothetical protein
VRAAGLRQIEPFGQKTAGLFSQVIELMEINRLA